MSRTASASTFDELLTRRIPPHSLEAERAILGVCLLEQKGLPATLQLLEPEDFYKEGHRYIFCAVRRLHQRDQPVDLLTVSEELKREQELEAAGGPAALALLIEEAATSGHVRSYCRIVREKSVKRDLIKLGTDFVGAGYDDGRDVGGLLDTAAAAITRLAIENTTSSSGNGPLIVPAAELEAPAVRYLIEPLLPAGMLTLLSGKDKRGKTLLAQEMVRAVLEGGSLLGHFAAARGPVVAAFLDDPLSMTLERLTTLGLRQHPELFLVNPLRYRDGALAFLEVLTSLRRSPETPGVCSSEVTHGR